MPLQINASHLLKSLDSPIPGKDVDRVIVLQKDGCIVFIGCNAMSNEKIITEHPHPDCLVFHAWGAKGSYVVLCHGSSMTPFTDDLISFGAQTALKHSRSELRSVLFSRVSEMYHPDGSSTGVFRSNVQITIEVP